MLKALTAAARVLRERIGWHRIGVVASLVIIAIAMATLYRMVRDVEVAKVWDALHTRPHDQILAASAFIGGAYLTLTFYDLFALRTIGRAGIPYRIAALASFTSFAIGHNVGATAFTGGAVRYRIYSAWG
jgi:glycosyltransferase 2 family protein